MNAAGFLRYYRGWKDPGEVSLWEEMTRAYPWFQEGWMLWLRSLRAAGDPSFEEVLAQAALRITNRRILCRMVEGSQAETLHQPAAWEYLSATGLGLTADTPLQGGGEGQNPANPRQELVERFLAGGAAFATLRSETSGTQGISLAEKAAEIPGDIITETFVNLLVQQGKYQEAIDAFEKLSLRFPGKSIYFAARIEEVKRIMNY